MLLAAAVWIFDDVATGGGRMTGDITVVVQSNPLNSPCIVRIRRSSTSIDRRSGPNRFLALPARACRRPGGTPAMVSARCGAWGPPWPIWSASMPEGERANWPTSLGGRAKDDHLRT